jgi:hypothetical protein
MDEAEISFSKGYDVLSPVDDLADMELGDLALMDEDSTSFSKGYDVLSPVDDLADMELGDLAHMDEDSTSFSKGYDVLSPVDDLADMELGDLALLDEAEIYNLTSLEEDLVPFAGPFGDLSLYDTNLTSAQNATEDSSGRHLDCNAAYTYRGTSTLVNFATGRVLDSNGAEQVYTLGGNGGNYQKWRRYYSDCFKTYVLMNQATEKVLDSDGSGNVYTKGYNGGNFQKWKRYNAGDGRVFLQNVATDRVLDSSASGNVYTLGYNGGNFQKWSI